MCFDDIDTTLLSVMRFTMASIPELASLGDESFQFTVNLERPPDYFVPAAVCSAQDMVAPPAALIDGFIHSRCVSPPRNSITQLRNCFVLPNAAVVTSSGRVLRESCFPYSTPWLTQFFQPWLQESGDRNITVKLEPTERIERPAFYCREHGEQGFFHWMHSVYPRLNFLRQSTLGREYALLYKAKQNFQRDGLRIAGLEDWPVEAPNDHSVQFFSSLLFPAPLVDGGDFWLRSTSVGAFYDSLPAVGGSSATERVYVTRRGAEVRRLKNEDALLELLKARGFTVVECGDYPFAEQLAIFRKCKFMIGAHGAGLSHAISMAPGSRLLEILHPRRFWATYRAIAARRGVHYGFVVGSDSGLNTDQGDTFDFDVDLSAVLEVLNKLGLP